MKPSQLPDIRNAIVAVDTETSGLHPDDGARVSVVSIAWEHGAYAFPFDQGILDDKALPAKVQPTLFDTAAPNLPEAEWVALLDWLERQWLVAHNAKFDLTMLLAGTRHWPGRDLSARLIGCTSIAASLIWPLERAGLKATAERLWGVQERNSEKQVKAWLKGKGQPPRYDLVPWDIMEPYATIDAELCYRLWGVVAESLDAGDLPRETWDLEMQLLAVLFAMEQRGIGFDQAAAWAADDLIVAAQQEAAQLVPFRPINQTGAKHWFFDICKLEPYKLTDTGKISVDQDVIRRLEQDGHPGAAEFAHYNQLGYAHSMWYDAWPRMCGADGRLRPVYHQTKSDEGRGTKTGRLSVERVQLQAVPHDYRLGWLPDGVPPVRRLFKPAKGHRLFELDMSQAEMRVAAGESGCGSLIAAFERGEDAHDATCRLMFGIEPGDPDWDEYRTVSKRLNFGMLYGAGARKIQSEIALNTGRSVSDHEVRDWLERYRNSMPEMVRYAKAIERSVEKRRWLRLATGRMRWFREDEHAYKAFNALIQGNVAEMMKLIMVEVETHWPGYMLLQVHDSIVLEIPEEDDPKVRVAEIADHMAAVFERYFPVPFRTDSKEWK